MPRDLLARSTLAVVAKAGLASAAMAAVLIALRDQSLGLLVPVGAAVYVLVGVILRLVPPEDFRMVGAALARRSRMVEAEETQA